MTVEGCRNAMYSALSDSNKTDLDNINCRNELLKSLTEKIKVFDELYSSL